jgi:hypothetical protein
MAVSSFFLSVQLDGITITKIGIFGACLFTAKALPGQQICGRIFALQ